MLASFPWYDLPSVQWANDSLWRATGYVSELARYDECSELWYDTDLLVSQACGLDLFLSDAPIEPIAAPVFDLDCEAGMYFSYIVGQANGSVAAVNSLSSRSGWSALLSICSPQSVVVTGSHQASVEALSIGTADVAAIDAVTWSILERDVPTAIEGVEVVAQSPAASAPPYVVRRGSHHRNVWRGLQRAFESPTSNEARRALFLKGIVPVGREYYLPVLKEFNGLKRRAGAIIQAPRLQQFE